MKINLTQIVDEIASQYSLDMELIFRDGRLRLIAEIDDGDDHIASEEYDLYDLAQFEEDDVTVFIIGRLESAMEELISDDD